MKDLMVWLYGTQNPVIYTNIEEFYENIKSIKIIQEELYKTTTTVIYKQAIIRWSFIETR